SERRSSGCRTRKRRRCWRSGWPMSAGTRRSRRGSRSEAREMANVLLATNTLSHASVTNTTAALQAAGHTVTPILDTELTSTDVSGYDVIVGVLSTNTQAIANALRATGKPLVLPLVSAGLTGNIGGVVNDTVPYFMGLCGRV